MGEDGGWIRPGGSGNGSSAADNQQESSILTNNLVLTKNENMPNSNILEGSSPLVRKYIVQLIKSIQPLDHMSKDCMFPIEVVNAVRQGDEELAAAAAYCFVVPDIDGWCNRHRDRSFMCVFEAGHELGGKIAGSGGRIRGV